MNQLRYKVSNSDHRIKFDSSLLLHINILSSLKMYITSRVSANVIIRAIGMPISKITSNKSRKRFL